METRKYLRTHIGSVGHMIRELMDIYTNGHFELRKRTNVGDCIQCCATWAGQALLCITLHKNYLILSSSVRKKTDCGLWFTEIHKAAAVLRRCSRLILSDGNKQLGTGI